MKKAWYNLNDGQSNWSSPAANAAYDCGKLPISKLPGILARFIKENNVEADEWHHTGKFAKRTNFYDVERIKKLMQQR